MILDGKYERAVLWRNRSEDEKRFIQITQWDAIRDPLCVSTGLQHLCVRW